MIWFSLQPLPLETADRVRLMVTLVGGAIAAALLMSTQFLLQPFVWENWPWQDVLAGWLRVARDETIVAVAIAAAVTASLAVPRLKLPVRAWLTFAAIIAGASLGQIVLAFLDADNHLDVIARLGLVLRWAAISGVLSVTFYYWRRGAEATAAIDQARRAEARLEESAALERLTALRRQIEPHFLFNTFATIRQLYQSGPVEGRRLMQHLLTFTRASLDSAPDTMSTLGQEIDLAEAYLGVFQERMSGRLRVTVDVDPELRAVVFPPFTLATLAENAIKHGISPSTSGGTVHIAALRTGDGIEVSLSDTGVGFRPESSGSGTGLANIRARLQLRYGLDASLSVRSNTPCGVVAAIRIPSLQKTAP